MGWLRALIGRVARRPTDFAERLSSKGLFRVGKESVALTDRETVRRWLRELSPQRDQQVFVHRPWGAIAAVADGRHPVEVFWAATDNKSYRATAPGAPESQRLTPDQVEHIILDALTSTGPPEWPDWQPHP